MIEKQLKQIQQKRVQSKARDNFFNLVLFMQTLDPFEAPLVASRGRRSARTLIIHNTEEDKTTVEVSKSL